MRRRLTWKAVLWIAVIAMAPQMPLRAALTEELHKTWPIDADGRVSLKNVNGAVHISAWDRNEVQVDAISGRIVSRKHETPAVERKEQAKEKQARAKVHP